ncbi:MAG: hypothetical protein M3321_11190, partial [Actinomycetota bacterium]|nr:hypothetical protein [Actinomycetota bacterium]
MAIRTAVETTTRPAIHAHAGTARTKARDDGQERAVAVLPPKPDLAKPLRELVHFGAVRGDPDVGGGGGDLAEDGVADGRPARRLLQRGGV